MSLTSRRLAAAFSRDKRGSVNIILAFSLLPMIGLLGLGIDYGIAEATKIKLDNAADSAAIAAVATAKAFVAANPNDSNVTADAKSAGTNRATRAFNINAGSLSYSSVPVPNIQLDRKNQTFVASVSYATQSKTNFGQIFGTKYLNVSGTAAASADIPSYLDFYLLVDVSGSMGLPSTSSGQSQLIGLNNKSPDPFSGTTQGCVFACHFPGYHGWTLATQNNIQLRSGAVNTAVCGLLTQAGLPLVPNQYRVGIYPFITQLGTLSALSSTLTNANIASNCSSSNPQAFTNLLDTGTTQEYTNNDPSTGTGSGGTNFTNVLPAIQTIISQGAGFGTGAATSNSRPFVFIITDGMQNGQYYGTSKNGTWYFPGSPSTFSGYSSAGFNGGSSPQAITSSQCSSLKSSGATISILYIPYLPIPTNPDPYGENTKADNAIPNLPLALANCATSGFFYTANTPADINKSLGNMFQQAIQVAHLSQ